MDHYEKALIKDRRISLLSLYRSELMGLAMIAVFLYHFTQDTRNTDINRSVILDTLFAFHGWFGAAGVDIFLILSGLSIYFSLKKNSDLKKFYKKRFSRILVPYIIVAGLFYMVYDIIKSKDPIYFIKDITFYNFFADRVVHYWYILLILLCYIVSPILFRYVNSSNSKARDLFRMAYWIVLFCTLSLVLYYLNNPLYKGYNIFFMRIPFYVIGMILGKMIFENKKYSIITIVLFLTYVISKATATTIALILERFVCAVGLITILIMLTVLVHNLLGGKNIFERIIRPTLSWIGYYSLELYLCHITLRMVFIRLGYHCAHYRYEFLMIITSVLCSIFLKAITECIIKKIRIG